MSVWWSAAGPQDHREEFTFPAAHIWVSRQWMAWTNVQWSVETYWPNSHELQSSSKLSKLPTHLFFQSSYNITVPNELTFRWSQRCIVSPGSGSGTAGWAHVLIYITIQLWTLGSSFIPLSTFTAGLSHRSQISFPQIRKDLERFQNYGTSDIFLYPDILCWRVPFSHQL